MNYKGEKEFNLKNNKERDRMYSQFSDEQKNMFHSIQDNIFTFCEANAGTGKTLVAVASLLDLLANNIINKIVYLQKPSKRYLQNGLLPGDLDEKTEKLWDPFYDAMLKLGYDPFTVDGMVNQELIYLTTDTTLRGVNFENVGLCIDEAQNADCETLRLIFTRCHDACRIIMLGDVNQKDNKGRNTDFIYYGYYLSNKYFGNKCKLVKNFRGDFSNCAEKFNLEKYMVSEEAKEIEI